VRAGRSSHRRRRAPDRAGPAARRPGRPHSGEEASYHPATTRPTERPDIDDRPDIDGVPDIDDQGDAWFEAVLRSVPDGVIVVDDDGLVIEVNREAEVLFGYPREELVGQPVEALLPESVRSRHRDHRSTYRANPVPRSMGTGLELVAERRNGERFLVDVSLGPVPGPRREVLVVVRDITEQRLAIATLADSEKRLRESEALAHVGSWGLDAATGVVQWSEELHRIHGIEPSDFDGTLDGALAFLHPDDRAYLRPLELALTERTPVESDYRILRPDHQMRWLHARAEPVLDHEGTVIGLRGICQDVTEHHDAAEAIQAAYDREREAAERLRAADLVKDEFLATISHELRTPLTTILGFAPLLRDPPASLQLADVVERIERNARDMLGMVERVLDFSRLTAGAIALRPQAVVLDDLVGGLLDDIAGLPDDRIKFSPGTGALRVSADREATRHILGNLLSNAVKFSPPGGVIEVATGTEDGAGVVSVADDGCGIPSELRERVFERFYRAAEQPPGERGAGVGLAIARRYAEMQGGRIWCDAAAGGGAVFRFTVPAAGRRRLA